MPAGAYSRAPTVGDPGARQASDGKLGGFVPVFFGRRCGAASTTLFLKGGSVGRGSLVLLLQRSAHGIVREDEESLGPKGIDRMCVINARVPSILIHVCDAAGNEEQFVFREDPFFELEITEFSTVNDSDCGTKTEGLRVNGLEKR